MLVLGVLFFLDYKLTQTANWTAIVEDVKNYLDRSKGRDLSLKGRVLVLNILTLSKIRRSTWLLRKVLGLIHKSADALRGR